MALPIVDNFWHGQATVMLSPRLPLYIPCMYVLFMYYPTVAAARFGRARLSTAALAGLIAITTYAPFDIVGVKFLWWSWHDTDAPIRSRLLGVPTSSTLWVLTFVGAFAWLVSPALLSKEAPSGRASFIALLRVAGLTTLTMMLQMIAVQQIDGGRPGYRSLAAGLVGYGAIAAYGLRARRAALPHHPQKNDWVPFIGLVAYFIVLIIAVTAFDPATHVSTGVHETIGPCDITATDITGATRRAFLCLDDFDEDYDASCKGRPPSGARWYTICGRPFERRGLWMGAVISLSTLAAFAYFRAFRGRTTSFRGDSHAAT
jgi:hypothetical protein